jgi:hypothetical protein
MKSRGLSWIVQSVDDTPYIRRRLRCHSARQRRLERHAALSTVISPDSTIKFVPNGPGFIDHDGALGMKMGWWRNIPGSQLEITGRRVDPAAPPLRACIPHGYPDHFPIQLRRISHTWLLGNLREHWPAKPDAGPGCRIHCSRSDIAFERPAARMASDRWLMDARSCAASNESNSMGDVWIGCRCRTEVRPTRSPIGADARLLTDRRSVLWTSA